MPIFHTEDGPGILYIHVPKTGGTYIEQLFRSNGYEMLLWAKRPKALGLRCSPQHFHREFYESFVDFEAGNPAFMTVRHPVDRLFSVYRNALRRGAYKGALEDWLSMVGEKLDGSLLAHGNHLRPQTDFHHPTLTIFRQEDGFGADWAKNLDRTYALSFTRFEVKARRPVNLSSHALSEAERGALLRFCEQRYKDDFEMFGYEPKLARCLR